MTTNVTVEGTCDERFAKVREEFARNFSERDDLGASVAITVNGEPVVELWGGYADPDRQRPWQQDTLVNVYSTTKGLTALCAHMLVDRGQLDIDRPVAEYWPEFAQAGKESVTVRHLLTHQAGLTGPAEYLRPEEILDWDRVCSALAATPPWWEPGTMSGYHALTFGFLVGEVVRRVSGRSPGTFLSEEVAEPLAADLHIGLPASELGRCAVLTGTPDSSAILAGLTELHPGLLALGNAIPGDINSPEVRMAELPAANGHVTALGLAKVYGALANGGEFAGTRLVSPEAIERMREPQPPMRDLMLSSFMGGDEHRWGCGFMLNLIGADGPNPRAFGHGGAGGSVGFADPENRVSYAYVMNLCTGGTVGDDLRSTALVDALYAALAG